MRRKRAPRPPSTRRNAIESERPRLHEDAAIAQRRTRALDLAIAGASYRQIAAQCDVSLATAYEDVQAELGALNAVRGEQAERLRELSLRRLDKWTLALAPKAQHGDEKAVRVLVQIEDRRARLLGLDAPVKQAHEHSGPDGAPLVTRIERVILPKKDEADD